MTSVVMVRAYRAGTDAGWAEALLDAALGGRMQARRGELVDVLGLPGLAAEVYGATVGLLMYQQLGDECEVAAIVAQPARGGIGTALIEALRVELSGCRRIWLVTTNDNLDALRFYQRRGFVLCALRPGAVDEARRRLKPSISTDGAYRIPLRDELELELRL